MLFLKQNYLKIILLIQLYFNVFVGFFIYNQHKQNKNIINTLNSLTGKIDAIANKTKISSTKSEISEQIVSTIPSIDLETAVIAIIVTTLTVISIKYIAIPLIGTVVNFFNFLSKSNIPKSGSSDISIVDPITKINTKISSFPANDKGGMLLATVKNDELVSLTYSDELGGDFISVIDCIPDGIFTKGEIGLKLLDASKSLS